MTALILLLIAAAYILLGTFHLAAPSKVLPVYRLLLGRRLFAKNASRFEQITRTNWKLMGAAYILFGMFLVWSLRSRF
ncbi:hypothetical protein [Edaphobacter dinghuensis]|uniref:Uncharacterized protein n=1 Tax=Edaphobacter dinghuensis TaxID=1560005 RepID=A0A917HIC1_9BACT|nr:hypothetical protein [Edaphobacter dinghuensis]GGG80247.1 hypothetical protein GCM10011585_24520 [Edaphobacter dinghuensis]